MLISRAIGTGDAVLRDGSKTLTAPWDVGNEDVTGIHDLKFSVAGVPHTLTPTTPSTPGVAGDAFTVVAAAGANADTDTSTPGSLGGVKTASGGDGGNGTAALSAGNGGPVYLLGGNGGKANGGTGGDGAAAQVLGGNGTGTLGVGGSASIDAGDGVTRGEVLVGATHAVSVTVGNNSCGQVDINGTDIVLHASGSPVFATGVTRVQVGTSFKVADCAFSVLPSVGMQNGDEFYCNDLVNPGEVSPGTGGPVYYGNGAWRRTSDNAVASD